MSSLSRSEAVARAAAIEVTQMSLNLDLTTGDATFYSRATIDFEAQPGASTFVDFKGVELVSASLNGQALDVNSWADGRFPLRLTQKRNQLVIGGVMAYSGDGEGLHRHIDPTDGLVYVYAMSFLDAAPRWFACFDQPDLKAPYHFEVTAPAQWTIWGNGESLPGADIGDGRRRWSIDQPCPLASYFVTLAGGPWAVVRAAHAGIPLALLSRASLSVELNREASNIWTVTKASFDAYHSMFARPYPYGVYTQAFVPDFNAGAMENPGLITLRDQYLLRGRPTRADRALRAGTIAHEMAHQWFGDLVTMRWWDDLWLNESFAEFMGHKVIAEHTDYDLWTQFAIMRQDWGSVADQGPSTHPVAMNGAADAQAALADFDGISYAKGAALLRQLAASMGDEVFLRGLGAYFDAHRFGNASFADLVDAWRQAGAVGVDGFASQWLATSGMDKISVTPGGDAVVIEYGRSGPAPTPDDACNEDDPTAMGATAGPERTDASSPPDLGGRLRLVGGCGGASSNRRSTPVFPHHGGQRSALSCSSGVSFEVAALGADGAHLSRQTVLDATPGVLALDEMPPDTAVVVPDAGGVCWARLRPSTWQLPPVAKVGDASTRAVLHNAIRDGVRAGELPVVDALGLLRDGLPGEPDDDIVAAMSRFAVDLAGVWTPFPQRASRQAAVASLLSSMMAASPPGSDRQAILARALVRCTTDRALLESWLTPAGPATGLVPDPALRWDVVTRLVALGGDEDIVEAELARDLQGADRAAGARAAVPTPAAKQAASVALLEPSNKRAYELYAIAENIWQVGQEDLCAAWLPQWFDGISETASWRQGWALAKVASLSFPLAVASPAALPLAQRALASVNDQRLRRELKNSIDYLTRVLRAQR